MITSLHNSKHCKMHHSQTLRDYEKIQKRVKQNEGRLEFITEYLDHYFGAHVNTVILNSLAKIIMETYGISLDRLAKRNRSALLCWYSENWDKIYPVLNALNIGRKNESLFKTEMKNPLIENYKPLAIREPKCDDPLSLEILLNCH